MSLPPPAVADKGHLWKQGQSGNPAGRPRGTKNAISLVKAQMEASLREDMRPQLEAIVTKVMTMALDGDKEMLKLVWTSWISKAQASDEEPTKERIQINISGMNTPGVAIAPAKVGETFESPSPPPTNEDN